ncbi:hypothetical protein M199_gp256 [Halogranum tailed virus 1]|uniref:DUF488 domain-containing protein n=1 Tax=Halogranum tailed virus 1 TaxID=1273749 RepID=R4T947_9CAUD|nr:hypothetical protein M199_gp256 [Halogranum tailed virus 1]AGM11410.1 hypothetical protein HGTV1_112 [Halogranum tailed virus 1]
MTGRLKQACFHTLSDKHDPNQATLQNYGADCNETKIAVVRKPNDTGILDVTDEWTPVLGMPEKYLKKFWKRRSEYRMNSAIDEPGDRAYEDLDLDEKYVEYIRNSDEAQRAIDDLVRRLRTGESITLVCFERENEHCHRHVLLDMIAKRAANDFSTKEKLTAEN